MHVTAWLLALGVAAAPGDFDPRDKGADRIDVSSYPSEQQQKYAVFSAKCSKCHPLARPINSRFDQVSWKKYVKRMIRRPNSGINEEQAQQIYEFLVFYSGKLGIK